MIQIKPLSEIIKWVDVRNRGIVSENLLGINIDKCFMPSVANIIGTDLSNYKLISKNQFACNPMHVGRDEKMPIAIYCDDVPSIVSPAYFVFEVKNSDLIIPDYLMLWFSRAEFDRECWFHTDGSVRGGITWEEIVEMTVPIPPFDEQNAIVEQYKDIERRIELKRQINDNLESQISSLFKSKLFQNASCEYGVLNDLVITTLGGDWGEANNNLKCKVRCIRGTDIPVLNVGIISNAPTRYIPYKNCETKHLIPNDLVVEISGGSPTQSTGRIAIMTQRTLNKTSEPFICSNFCRILRIKPSYISYFLQLWKYLYSCGRMFCYENSSTGLKNFDLEGFLQEENIFIPDEITAQEFNSTIFPIIEQQQVNGDEIEALTELSNNILSTRLSKLSR